MFAVELLIGKYCQLSVTQIIKTTLIHAEVQTLFDLTLICLRSRSGQCEFLNKCERCYLSQKSLECVSQFSHSVSKTPKHSQTKQY